MSGYRDDGCGGGPWRSEAWQAAIDRENESYREINERVARSAYVDLKAKYDAALQAIDELQQRLAIAAAGLGHDESHIEYDNAVVACDLTRPLNPTRDRDTNGN